MFILEKFTIFVFIACQVDVSRATISFDYFESVFMIRYTTDKT